MKAKQFHDVAVEARDSLIESMYSNIFMRIHEAAQEGKFQIIVDEVDAQDDLISYLCRNEFHVEYYNKFNNAWYPCTTTMLVPWLYCNKILIRW